MFSLALSNLRLHKVRAALTVSAIALAASLVVAVTSGYASARATAYKFLAQYMGTTDAQITRSNESRGGIPQDLVARIGADPDVVRVDGRLELESPLLNAAGQPVAGRAAQVIGLQRPQDRRVETLKMEAGRWFGRSDGQEAVIDQVASQRLKVEVGGTFWLPGIDRRLPLRVVGIVHKPGVLAAAMQTIYVPLHTLQDFMMPRAPRQVSRVLIDLREGADEQAFLRRWRDTLHQIDPLLKLRLSSENRSEMDKNLQGLHLLSYLGGSVSMVAAMFIVFSALSMGVAERQRTLAMLRAIGAFRGQLGRLVLLEGLFLAVAGVAIGVPLGMLWIRLLVWRFDTLFAAGAVLSLDGLAAAALGSIAAAAAASFLPAWAAMRTDPLEAMSPLAHAPPKRVPALCAILGLLLLGIDPLLLFAPVVPAAMALGFDLDVARGIQFFGHFAVGLPCIIIGFFLLAPTLVRLVERLLGPLVAAAFRLRFAMLRQQLSGGVWRAAGTCAALMVGLAILIVTQTQGHSAISGWKLPDRFPDFFIASSPGLLPQDQEKLAHIEGIKPGELMPIAIASPEFGSGFLAIAGLAMMPNATMFFGIDPDKALDMMELDFRDGNPAEARRLLKLGRHIIVTQEFRQIRGLGVGDTLPLKTREGVVDFTVAGVVWSPGIDVIASVHDLGRQFDQRTAASVFGTLDDARRYFGVERIHIFAANLEPNVDKAALLARIKRQLGGWGLDGGDVRHIKYHIQRGLSRLLLLVSTIAYAAMAVASLGVTNTIMASIRSRRWQFGILRSIGITRGQLLRTVLAEAVLLGLVACILGLAAGAEMTISARQEWATAFGYKPPLAVPWGTLAIGLAAVMLISLLASLYPALNVARAEPLELLQAGRAAA